MAKLLLLPLVSANLETAQHLARALELSCRADRPGLLPAGGLASTPASACLASMPVGPELSWLSGLFGASATIASSAVASASRSTFSVMLWMSVRAGRWQVAGTCGREGSCLPWWLLLFSFSLLCTVMFEFVVTLSSINEIAALLRFLKKTIQDIS
jgi:hypothetical protein